MELKNIIKRSRSYRRFDEKVRIAKKTLVSLIELARFSPCAGNRQPLKYIISNTQEKNSLVFPTLTWARDLKDWTGPKKGQRPSAYIIILGDKQVLDSFGCDHGIAAQSILLGATEKGLGGCMIGLIKRELLQKNLDIPARFEILLVIALGKPKETILLRDASPGTDVKYYRDAEGRHIVPKRNLEELILDL